MHAAQRPEVFRAGAAGFISAAGRSHEHVCRSLKAHFGVTPSMFVNRMRMEHAGRLLTGTDIAPADIAVDCGIDTISHFHALFRTHFGVTPRRYRLSRRRDPVQPGLRPG
ncbi:helix-turn-helix transcriptional regulator [Novosphingobium acidiphilum]|uniref:helix-turn-helix transcriptional regulator n=1 Tax=Novosphingobium acidiphilum TaxID=505248 RepID=UPI000A03CEE0